MDFYIENFNIGFTNGFLSHKSHEKICNSKMIINKYIFNLDRGDADDFFSNI